MEDVQDPDVLPVAEPLERVLEPAACEELDTAKPMGDIS
jgi:hypothetical protein